MRLPPESLMRRRCPRGNSERIFTHCSPRAIRPACNSVIHVKLKTAPSGTRRRAISASARSAFRFTNWSQFVSRGISYSLLPRTRGDSFSGSHTSTPRTATRWRRKNSITSETASDGQANSPAKSWPLARRLGGNRTSSWDGISRSETHNAATTGAGSRPCGRPARRQARRGP